MTKHFEHYTKKQLIERIIFMERQLDYLREVAETVKILAKSLIL